jgi:hypothetical protein
VKFVFGISNPKELEGKTDSEKMVPKWFQKDRTQGNNSVEPNEMKQHDYDQ